MEEEGAMQVSSGLPTIPKADQPFHFPAAGADGPAPAKDTVAIYVGISFWVFLGLLPRASVSYSQSLHTRLRSLAMQLFHAEEQIRQMRSRRKEDSKANARVVEIFAGHRNEWQQEEKRLLERVDRDGEEIRKLKRRVEELEINKLEGGLRMERITMNKVDDDEEDKEEQEEEEEKGEEDFVEKEVESVGRFCGEGRGLMRTSPDDLSSNNSSVDCRGGGGGGGGSSSGSGGGVGPEVYGQQNRFAGEDFFSFQDTPYGTSPDSQSYLQHFLSRRESPWKVDAESTGVSTRLKLLQHELVALDKLGNGGLSKPPTLAKKQAKRYHSLSTKIYHLCKRMQDSDPSEPNLDLESRTQRQTDFLMEAFQLQHRAVETRHKLTTLQVETTSSYIGDELTHQGKMNTKKSLESIRNHFKEIQRNLEVLLARIIGDLEGILAREGATHVRDYYFSRYPFVR